MSVEAKELQRADDTAPEPCLVYELSTQYKSSWTPNPKNKNKHRKDIKTAKFLSIAMESRWNGGKGVGELKTQYVQGAPTIFVNDYVEGNEHKKGLRSLYGQDALTTELKRQSIEEDIKFVDGILFLEHYGGAANKALIDFIEHHEFNENAPNYKMKRNMNSIFKFKPLLKEKKAAAEVGQIDVEFEAYKLLNSLSNEKGGKREYDTNKINAILGIFGEGGDLDENQSGDKLLLLRAFVKRNASGFLAAYKEAIAEYEKALKVAISLKVVTLEPKAKGASIKLTGIEEPFKVELNSEKEGENFNDLILYFLGTTEGKMRWEQVLVESDTKRIEVLGKKK